VGDASFFPSYDRYVNGLPGGLGAHPAAQAKGSIVRSHLEDLSPGLLRSLPTPLLRLAADPPVDSDWVPETYLCALIHAIAERRRYSEREFLAWIRARNRALFARPLYRLLMTVVSPEALMRHAGRRWGNFHRGSSLELDGYSDDGARFTLSFPEGLFDRAPLLAFGQAFAAALELAGAKDPLVDVETEGVGFARYLARW
jgi:hypothetical protein